MSGSFQATSLTSWYSSVRFVVLNGFIPLNALERLPFALQSPIFQQSCNFSRT